MSNPVSEGFDVNFTPASSISLIYSIPKASFLTLPIKAEDPPKNENPTAEFAADPPEATLLSGIILCNFSISSFSTGLHDPGSIP